MDGQTLGGPPRPNGKGHRLCHSATVTPDGPGAKAPGQRTPRHRRALCAHRGPRWPLVARVAPVLRVASRAGGGKAVRFLVPARPGGGARRRVSRCGGWSDFGGPPRPNGKGHRLCHSATVTPRPAGGQSPRPAHAPPMAGASHPPGPALASRCAGCDGPRGSVPRGRGKRGAFPCPRPARRGARGGGFRAVAAGKAPQPQPAARGAAIRRSGRPARKPVCQGLGIGYLAGKGFGPSDVPAAAQRRLGHHTRSPPGGAVRASTHPTPTQSLPNP